MSNIFEVRDPRGILVYCSERQWNEHIVSYTGNHPLMKDNIPAVVDTINNPDAIYESHDSVPPMDYREVYVKKSKMATYINSKAPYTKVVVFSGGGTAEVITAYNTVNETGGTIGDAVYIRKSKS